MNSNQITKRTTALMLSVVLVLPAMSFAEESEAFKEENMVDAEALELLQKATDFLAAEKLFRVNTETEIEFVLTTGQKLQFVHHVTLTVQRPNRLRAERLGELADQSFYYDGKSLSINAPGTHYYATEPAPDTIDGTLDFIRDDLGFTAPASDLVYSNAWERLSTDLTSGFVVGTALIDGYLCDHVAFRNEVVDWQIWIQQGDLPLPRKMVITSKRYSQSPQFTVSLSNWEKDFEVSETDFTFAPPEGSTRIDFITAADSTTR